jgi:hypothetical protein
MFDTVSCIAFFCIFRVVTVLRVIFLDGWNNVIDLFVYPLVYALASFSSFFRCVVKPNSKSQVVGEISK